MIDTSPVAIDFEKLERERVIISLCGKYRYALYRDLKKHPKYMQHVGHAPSRIALFVMLNPSTADGTTDDNTIRRCLGFAYRLGCDQLMVANLFAYRTKDPHELRRDGVGGGSIIGPDNSDWIRAMVDVTLEREDLRGFVIAAWGPHGRYMDQDRHALAWIESEKREADQIWCFGRTKDGSPRHPLMLLGNTPLEEYKL